MLKLRRSLIVCVWTILLAGLSMSILQAQFSGTPGQQPVAPEPSSERERVLWKKVDQTEDLNKKSKAVREYLQDYPEGAYASYAHEIMAVHYRRENDLDRFYDHAEKALEGLPFQAALRVTLAETYAEAQKPDEAIRHGEQALQILENVDRTPEAESVWGHRREGLTADAHYAVGTAYLFKAFHARSAVLMNSGVEHLKKAVSLNPRDERSHFRLGFAYQMKRQAEEAIVELARAVALGGANVSMAQQYLEQAYQSVHGSLDGLDQVIGEQKQYLETTKVPDSQP